MQLLAKAIKKARAGAAEVFTIEPGMWHLPFTTDDDWSSLSVEELKILSVARCASVSYKTVDGFDMTIEKAKEIYEKLKGPPCHASPFEHISCADTVENNCYTHPEEHRNFRGFRQLRAQIEHA